MIKISTLTGKLAGFQAINTNTLTNAFCSKMRKTDAICSRCYSARMLEGIRKNSGPPWQRNSGLLSSSLLNDRELPVINARFFRFHAHGELINSLHFRNFCKIAEYNPLTTFALWTKRREIVRRNSSHIPENMILIYSNPRVDKVLTRAPKNFHKVFNVSQTGEVSPGQTPCTGRSCADCLVCYANNNHTIIVEKIK